MLKKEFVGSINLADRTWSVIVDGHWRSPTATVDISLLLKAPDSDESRQQQQPPPKHHTRSSSSISITQGQDQPGYALAGSSQAAKRTMGPHPAESPAKKQSKWSQEEDALIIDLRGGGMKWEDISKRLPGRSAISCRLHYQNYLERRSEWDEERKNKLARLYERFKPEMWAKVAEEMAVPWRAAEAMHWQLGEQDMARRAGVVPFSLSNVPLDTPPRTSPTRGHAHSQSMSSAHSSSQSQSSIMSTSSSGPRYHRPTASVSSNHMRGSSIGTGRAIAARRESTPRSVPPTSPNDGLALAAFGTGLPTPRGTHFLPSVAEMTTGVSPYSTPAYSMSSSMTSGYASPGPLLPSLGMYSTRPDAKRRSSPDPGPREPTRRRQ